jgi:hypothetical protein
MMAIGPSRPSLPVLLLLGFVAGALATLIFHQLTVWSLGIVGMSEGNAYSLGPVPPFGVPQVINYAFWGGLWGCVFAVLADRFPRNWPLWLAGLVFGLLGPTLVGWLIVAPIKGRPIANGFVPSRMINSPIIHAMFGLGTALFYDLLRRWMPARTRWA